MYFKTLSLTALATCIFMVSGPSAAVADVKPGKMTISRKTVKGQVQMTGHYGALWSETEIRDEADRGCKQAGLKLATFQLGELTKRKGQAFIAVCQ